MAERDTFVNVNDGDQLNDGYFNGIKTDVSNTTTGHDHDGVDSKAKGWVLVEKKTFSASGSGTTTFSSLPTKKVFKLFFRITSATTNWAATLRFNSDTGANYDYLFANNGTMARTLGATGIQLGAAMLNNFYLTGELIFAREEANSGSYISVQGQLTSRDTGNDLDAAFGGAWDVANDITGVDIVLDQNVTGEILLFYLAEIE